MPTKGRESFVTSFNRDEVPARNFCGFNGIWKAWRVREKLNVNSMGHQVIIFDFSVVRGLWETRVKKHKERQRKEKERLEKSSLEKIKQEWHFILECRKKGIPQSKYLKKGFVDINEKILDTHGKTPQLQKRHALSDEANKEKNKFIFQLSGEQWMLSNLKQVTVVDLSANKFHSIPICVLRMSNLQWLDISSNNLKDLPEDIDRLDQLQTLLLQKNKLTYLPRALVNMTKLSLLVVSGDDLVEIPTAVCESTTGLKFVSLKDSPAETIVCEDTEEIIESEREREQFEKEFMKAYIEDLKERDKSDEDKMGNIQKNTSSINTKPVIFKFIER
ncbi:Lrrc2 [Columba guinea]|nr:Lrrc2 [Columba guinea]